MNNVEMVRTDLLIAMQISLLLGQNICCWQLCYRDTQATTSRIFWTGCASIIA